ncbi:hypothetical protein JAAARDRAFT_159113 [Jaapia argillacea MUCL 33604]|uniref:Arrestin C-terminal-like domain-containing protein n=1 Tax=Jaapia argillacea MUCL 33604 TaxID=933084 RepID=A0A067PPL1_9AGAM|nr:hypothetical protein JAAARDRAFT_159113 [Jaapia argillacea MUCL 33604]
MAFILTRPPSPSPRDRESHPHTAADVDQLSSALHAALSGTSSTGYPEYEMPKEKEKAHSTLEIVVNSDTLYLKGIGLDVEPTLLAGNVVLHLTEPMSIKEINLAFRGKARLPSPSNDPISLNNSSANYVVCSHEWSFLEGEKKHSHTLKAGRHLFPFQLQIGGSLPSSIFTNVLGGASVHYKLRATAVRPGFAHNLQAVIPITIMRTFQTEALEYQQTLEIENTWPEKLMYSIMIPHKAWAAGDSLTAVVKFSPLTKGTRVLNVHTTLNETTKLHVRSGVQENTRIISTTRHDIIEGKAFCTEEYHHRFRLHAHGHQNGHSTPRISQSGSVTPFSNQQSSSSLNGSSAGYFTPPHSHSDEIPTSALTHAESSSGPSSSSASVIGQRSFIDPDIPDDIELSQDDVITTLQIPIPSSATPTHSLDPIVVSYRIRWSILIGNKDGHTSELRCSLPVHILDPHLLDEARSATAATRRLVLGGSDTPEEEEEESELPSYPAHVRDRVANMYMPEGSLTVANPWVVQGVSPILAHPAGSRTPFTTISSGIASPSNGHEPVASSGSSTTSPPGNPTAHSASGASIPLDWVNSELLLSLQGSENGTNGLTESPTGSNPTTRSSSRPESRRQSRRGSRAPSPERGHANETFVHSSSASRGQHGLFHISMKPFTSLSQTFNIGNRGHTHSPVHTPNVTQHMSMDQHRHHQAHAVMGTPQDPNSGPLLLHRAFTEVPNYEIASRGFLGGGVPPLESWRGLPSYEETERGNLPSVSSDSDLSSRFSQASRAPSLASVIGL